MILMILMVLITLMQVDGLNSLKRFAVGASSEKENETKTNETSRVNGGGGVKRKADGEEGMATGKWGGAYVDPAEGGIAQH
jgi:hypothetical protein